MRILCVCTGNTCRSPMMASLLQEALRAHGMEATVESAGTGAAVGDPASAGAAAAMASRGLDLQAHRSRPIRALDLSVFDRIYTVSSRHAAYVRGHGVPPERIAVLAAEHGGVPYPWGGDQSVYEETAAVLHSEATRLAQALADGD